MSEALKPSIPVSYVDNASLLEQALEALKGADEIAFDLEFDSHRHAYGVTLCLIQIASRNECFIIDPLAKIDLEGVFRLFENPAVLKIMHSPGEDLRLLHALKCFPQNLFDTDATARLLNYEQTSLATMLGQKLEVVLNKQQQRSNWLRRPLTSQQLDYAADDVAYLHRLREVLLEEAKEKGVLELVIAEHKELGATVYEPEEKSFFLKGSDLWTLSPYNQYVLNGLFLYRDGLARHLNRPAYQVMDEALLRALSDGALQPAGLPEAKGLYGLYRTQAFSERVARRLSALKSEAQKQGLSKELPARSNWSPADRAARHQADKDRDEKFTPVQQELGNKFGSNAARYILSNGNVNEILKKSTSLHELKRGYKAQIISDTAAELGIDLSDYLGSDK